MTISIYCSPTDLRIVVGTANESRVRVEQFVEVPLPAGAMINGIITNVDAMTRFLKDVDTVHGPFKGDATVVVESNLVRTKLLTVPKAPERQVAAFVASEMQELSDGQVDEAFDYSVLGPGAEGGLDVLGVAVGRAMLAAYIGVVGNADFKLKKIDVGTNALIKAVRYLPQIAAGTNLLAVLDSNIMAISLFENGEYRITKKHRLLAPENTDARRQEAGNHLSSMIQFQKSQHMDSEIRTIFITGVSSERVQALAAATGYLHLPFEEIQLDHHLELTGKAAYAQDGFEIAKYIYNIGALIGK
ncbi:MAG: pilus assembly protein PilM [Coriobacteriales bacterium]|jgi:Tfp pilus assembly PilM family ATPase|nr:pilus assembly protein PilM [Coriobacteriales bacterium]